MAKKVFFVPHGGGPLPLMGEPNHREITALLQNLGSELDGSNAVVVATAHWEESVPHVSGGERPSLIFDYSGFPPETYQYEYPAPGAPELARAARDLLDAAGIKARIDMERGYDHGTFVPMMLMRPAADIPILQVSMLSSLDAKSHIDMGKALAPLLDQNVAFVGSGLTFHNMRSFMPGVTGTQNQDVAFDNWLNDTLVDPALSDAERTERMINWADAPGARFCHPREEHLLPLHVCFGAATAAGLSAENIHQHKMMGFVNSGFRWS